MLFLALLAFTAMWIGVAKIAFHKHITVIECLIQFGVTFFVIGVTLLIGDYYSIRDDQVFHGQVLTKDRVEDYFQTSYSCNCVCTARDKNGSCSSESCDTCYTDHYTVNWSLNTSLGGYQIDHIDREYKSAWLTPDPSEYVQAVIGQPFAKSHSYSNYFLYYKDSLFNNNENLLKYSKELTNSTYPKVTGYYVNLVFNAGVPKIDVIQYNDLVRQYLITAGAAKQVNVIIYFTPILDQSFRYALEAKWLGGKKNDVIIVIGVDPTSTVMKPAWVDVISMGKNIGNEMLQVSLREDLITADLLDPVATTSVIFKDIDKFFKRKPMSSFKYIEAARQTPMGVIMMALVLTILLNVGFTFLNIRYLDIREP